MIFVTVGAQMPFDRLIAAADSWLEKNGRTDCFAQIGPSEYRPKHMTWTPFLKPGEFRQRLAKAGLLIAHAGMGSILTALQVQKPLVIMPRRARYRETRNDHQVATALRFASTPGIVVAMDESELPAAIERGQTEASVTTIGPHASPQLLKTLQDFFDEPQRKP